MDVDGVDGRPAKAGAGSRGFGLTIAVLSTLLVLCGLPQIVPHAVPGPVRKRSATLSLIWPQDWAFFADASDTAVTVAYREASPGPGLTPIPAHQMSARNSWGLSRAATTEIIETQYLADAVPPQYWIPCDVPGGSSCLIRSESETPYELRNSFQTATLCGHIILIVEQPTSAADASPIGPRSPSSDVRSSVKTAALHVVCPA